MLRLARSTAPAVFMHDCATRTGATAMAPACATGLGRTADQLELIIWPGDHVFRNDAPIGIDASSESLQPGEPLLRHPLDATDLAPSALGLELPPIRAHDLVRCVALRRAERTQADEQSLNEAAMRMWCGSRGTRSRLCSREG